MSTNLPEQQPSEEVDLGQLFKLIGNAFDRLFRFIGNIFKGIFFLLIDFLVFIQGHIKKLALVGVLGILLGTYFDVTQPDSYDSQMIVEPNFNSARQLYNNIYSYNELAKAKDSVTLASALNISLEEAASVLEVSIKVSAYGNQKVVLYDGFIKALDTASRKAIDYLQYKNNFGTFDSRFHEITFISLNPDVAKKAEARIINSIKDNSYFELQKESNDQSIKLQEDLYEKQIKTIDTLQKTFSDVMREAASHPNGGTSINLSDTGSDNKEISLLKEIDLIKRRQVQLNEEKANTSEILNVISGFQDKGTKVSGILKSLKFLFFCVFVGLMFIALILLELNKYLKKYKLEKLR